MGATAHIEPDTARRPRRNDAARATWRQARAVELALEGRSYDDIAHAVGLANRGSAWRTVQKALHNRVVAGVDELREMEVDRLDKLQATVWPQVEAGNVKAIDAVMKIIDRRCRILGLYAVPQAAPGPIRTIVQPGSLATR